MEKEGGWEDGRKVREEDSDGGWEGREVGGEWEEGEGGRQ